MTISFLLSSKHVERKGFELRKFDMESNSTHHTNTKWQSSVVEKHLHNPQFKMPILKN